MFIPKTVPLFVRPELLNQDLSAKTYVVTGGNSGLGLATAAQLARQKATVVLGCRNLERGHAALSQLKRETHSTRVSTLELDLASFVSVRDFAARFSALHRRLDGLVNNAGIMNTPKQLTVDGNELQFQTNHLGHFLLTQLLLPALLDSTPSRIVVVSSYFHYRAFGHRGEIRWNDLNFQRTKYNGWKAYAQSKLANLLHAKELARRLAGTGVTAVSVNPGWVRTQLIRSFAPVWAQDHAVRPLLRRLGMLEPWEGIQPTLHALLAPEVEAQSGAFFSQAVGYAHPAFATGGWPLESPSAAAHDSRMAERLWEASESLVQGSTHT